MVKSRRWRTATGAASTVSCGVGPSSAQVATTIRTRPAPGAVTNAELGRAVGRILGRPSWLPTPAFALRALMGEVAALVQHQGTAQSFPGGAVLRITVEGDDSLARGLLQTLAKGTVDKIK